MLREGFGFFGNSRLQNRRMKKGLGYLADLRRHRAESKWLSALQSFAPLWESVTHQTCGRSHQPFGQLGSFIPR